MTPVNNFVIWTCEIHILFQHEQNTTVTCVIIIIDNPELSEGSYTRYFRAFQISSGCPSAFRLNLNLHFEIFSGCSSTFWPNQNFQFGIPSSFANLFWQNTNLHLENSSGCQSADQNWRFRYPQDVQWPFTWTKVKIWRFPKAVKAHFDKKIHLRFPQVVQARFDLTITDIWIIL